VELSQSKTEQQEYLKNVELARVLDKRMKRKKQQGEEVEMKVERPRKRSVEEDPVESQKKQKYTSHSEDGGVHIRGQLDSVLDCVF